MPVTYGPPQIDFSQLDPIGSYQKGAEVRRGYELRKGLSKIAPDDFQGMAHLLAQFGDPKDAVTAMQLQSSLRHQTVMEGLAERSAATSEASQRSQEQTRADSLALRDLKYGAPLRTAAAALPLFAEDAKALLTPGEGWKAAITGERGAAYEHILRSIAQLNGFDEKQFVEENKIGIMDATPELRKRKLDLVASYLPALSEMSKTLKIGDPSAFTLPPLEIQSAPQVPETTNLNPAAAGRRGVGSGEVVNAAPGEPPPVTVQGQQYPLTPKAAAALKAGSLTPDGWAIISSDPKYVALRKLYGLIP